jgi:hypothetical protein
MGRPASPKPGVVTFLEIRKVPTDKLHYDIKNIRLIHEGLSSEKDAEAAIWEQHDIELLYNDIKERGLLEEIIITNDNLVLEGNRRLAVCKRLFQQQQDGEIDDEHDFSSVKCKPISSRTSDLDIEAWLAGIHIAGKKEWPDFNQAKLLYKLYNQRHLTYDTLANITRVSKSTIIKKCDAYEYTERYHRKFPNDPDWSSKYQHFIEFLTSSLSDFRDDDNNVMRFMSWLYSKKITNSLDVRNLHSIINNKKAFRALEKDDIKAALKIAMEYDPTIKSTTYKKIVKLTKILEAFPTVEFVRTVEEESRLKLLRDLRNSANRLITHIESTRRSGKH